MSFNPEIGSELVRFYRAWHQLEGVIDFDAAPEGLVHQENPLTTRRDAIKEARRLRKETDISTLEGEYFNAKLLSTAALASAKEGSIIPFNPYIEQTMGIIPKPIPIEEIEPQFEKVRGLFRQFGHGDFTSANWETFLEAEKLLPEDRMPAFNEAKERFVPIIQSALGSNVELDFTLEFVEREVPWINSISGDASGIYFRVNTHEINRHRWIWGVQKRLAVHELGGHLVQIVLFRENIKRGLIDPGYGITTQPGPEQWGLEGLADNLQLLIPGLYDLLELDGQFDIEHNFFRNMVFNNAHLEVNGPNPDVETISSNIRVILPSEPASRIPFTLDFLRNNPMRRANAYAYGGGYYFRKAIEPLSDAAKIGFLKELYFRARTHQQVIRLINELQKAA